jgi:hypothetical protein
VTLWTWNWRRTVLTLSAFEISFDTASGYLYTSVSNGTYRLVPFLYHCMFRLYMAIIRCTSILPKLFTVFKITYCMWTCSDRVIEQDNKLHFRRKYKYIYTNNYINTTGCLNKILEFVELAGSHTEPSELENRSRDIGQQKSRPPSGNRVTNLTWLSTSVLHTKTNNFTHFLLFLLCRTRFITYRLIIHKNSLWSLKKYATSSYPFLV